MRKLDALRDVFGGFEQVFGLLSGFALFYKLCEVLHVDQAAEFVVEKDVKDFYCDNPLLLLLPLTRPVETLNGVLPGRLFFDVTIYFISGLNALLLLDYDVLETERGATTASRRYH